MPSLQNLRRASAPVHHRTRGGERLARVPLVILVGVTGVGKSTSYRLLRDKDSAFTCSRIGVLTDELIIAFLQRQAGATPCAVADRAERFALARRYREQFPGG
ncbi:MAG: hypothetical protein R2867_42760 [Caldilineaceae bacterium]